jgi:hypothetical protein
MSLVTMAAMSDRLSRALALKALQPLDGHRFADRVMTTRRSAAHLSLSTASITRSRKSCEYGFAISRWPPPSQQVESKSRRFGNPTPIRPKRRTL